MPDSTEDLRSEFSHEEDPPVPGDSHHDHQVLLLHVSKNLPSQVSGERLPLQLRQDVHGLVIIIPLFVTLQVGYVVLTVKPANLERQMIIFKQNISATCEFELN